MAKLFILQEGERHDPEFCTVDDMKKYGEENDWRDVVAADLADQGGGFAYNEHGKARFFVAPIPREQTS